MLIMTKHARIAELQPRSWGWAARRFVLFRGHEVQKLEQLVVKLHHITTLSSLAWQPRYLFAVPESVTVRWASCTASANRLHAQSCFSIDLFAPKPSFRVCAWVHIQLQTTYVRLLKHAWADARRCTQTHTHTCTPGQLAAPPGSHTP